MSNILGKRQFFLLKISIFANFCPIFHEKSALLLQNRMSWFWDFLLQYPFYHSMGSRTTRGPRVIRVVATLFWPSRFTKLWIRLGIALPQSSLLVNLLIFCSLSNLPLDIFSLILKVNCFLIRTGGGRDGFYLWFF